MKGIANPLHTMVVIPIKMYVFLIKKKFGLTRLELSRLPAQDKNLIKYGFAGQIMDPGLITMMLPLSDLRDIGEVVGATQEEDPVTDRQHHQEEEDKLVEWKLDIEA